MKLKRQTFIVREKKVDGKEDHHLTEKIKENNLMAKHVKHISE